MRLNYDGKTIGTITTNHSMSIEDCIESLELDINDYDYELFSTDSNDEYTKAEFIALISEDNEKKVEEMLKGYAGSEGVYGRIFEMWEESNRMLSTNDYIEACYDEWLNGQN